LLAYQTIPFLLFPKLPPTPFSLQGILYSVNQSFLKVWFPLRVKWIGSRSDFDVPFYGHTASMKKMLSFAFNFAAKRPGIPISSGEVFLFHPSPSFVPVSSSCPSP
jgi:hypothetical protein